MKRFCPCGHVLHKNTRGDKCRACIIKASRYGRRPTTDAAYLIDEPQMTDAECEIVADPARQDEAAVIIARQTDVVRRALGLPVIIER